jgi:hypothetical protein
VWRGTKDILMAVNARRHGNAHRHRFATAQKGNSIEEVRRETVLH